MLKQEQEDLLKAQRRLEQAVSFHSEVVLIRLFLWRLFGVDINKEIQRVEFHGQIFGCLLCPFYQPPVHVVD